MRRRVRMRKVTGPDEYGSVYIYFGRRRTVSECVRAKGYAVLDYDSSGRLICIELLEVPWNLNEPQEGK